MGRYYGRSLEARDLADLLHHFGVTPKTIRPPKVGEAGGGSKPLKGYRRDDLFEAWSRDASE